jgi:hypothetical protein
VLEVGGFHRQKSREGERSCGKKVDFFDDGAVFDQELSVFLRRSALWYVTIVLASFI